MISIGIFILLAALVEQSLKRAGRSEWENWKAKWEAKGEKFDIASVVPPKVPDDQNFAKSQFFAPLFDHDVDSATFNEARDRFDIKTASSLRYAWRKGKHRDFVVWESAFYESDLAKLAFSAATLADCVSASADLRASVMRLAECARFSNSLKSIRSGSIIAVPDAA